MTVDYGTSQDLAPSRLNFEDTLNRLREAIAARDLWLVAEIDPQALLARAGFDSPPARQLLFFHPRYAASVLAADAGALLDAPLKILVLALPDGSVAVRAVDSSARLGRVSAELGRFPHDIVSTVL